MSGPWVIHSQIRPCNPPWTKLSARPRHRNSCKIPGRCLHPRDQHPGPRFQVVTPVESLVISSLRPFLELRSSHEARMPPMYGSRQVYFAVVAMPSLCSCWMLMIIRKKPSAAYLNVPAPSFWDELLIHQDRVLVGSGGLEVTKALRSHTMRSQTVCMAMLRPWKLLVFVNDHVDSDQHHDLGWGLLMYWTDCVGGFTMLNRG